MSTASSHSFSGRSASLARRLALSAGKSALPPAKERVRNGDRSAAVPNGAAFVNGAAAPHHAAAANGATPLNGAAASNSSAHFAAAPLPAERPPAPGVNSSTASLADGSQSGRLFSMMRRRQLAGGKGTLAAAGARPSARVRPSAARPAAAAGEPAAASTPSEPAAERYSARAGSCATSCREQARERRAALSQRGRGEQRAAPPTRPPRQGKLEYAPKVTTSTTHGGQIVTGSRIGRGLQVTGDEPGALLPVSGTQYIGASDGAPVRSAGLKVGLVRTAGGGIVSGTLVRSQVSVTGDECGDGITITGEADQKPHDDVTPRAADGAHAAAQFSRQIDPHGHSVFGTNLGRSAVSLGSRVRTRQAPIEATENGLPITGSAVGRTGRVTGDENGVCRQVTGNQYLTPAGAQAECGGSGGGTAPAAQVGASRRDPVTGAKVSISQTWGQQRLTGSNVEHDPRVTGDAAGSCSLITGTPYQGAGTVHGWCDPGVAAAAEQRLPRRAATAPVSGDVPSHSRLVTGTERNSARELTGTPYFRAATQAPEAVSRDAAGADAPAADALEALDARFSICSPQRRAQLRARAAHDTQLADAAAAGAAPGGASGSRRSPAITGSFAIGGDRVTGNGEFQLRPRSADTRSPDANTPAARMRLTGEGRADGTRVTGWSWSEHSRVTGTEGPTAAARNPSERGGKPQAFSGAKTFKSLAKREETKQLVTGLLGWSGKTAARVTLSGGAQA